MHQLCNTTYNYNHVAKYNNIFGIVRAEPDPEIHSFPLSFQS